FKALLRDAGLPTARSLSLSPREGEGVRGRLESLNLSLPVFVKPVNGGSSVGVTKVKDWSRLDAALDLAFRYDERALLEEGIDARGLEVAGLRNDETRGPHESGTGPGHPVDDYD